MQTSMASYTSNSIEGLVTTVLADEGFGTKVEHFSILRQRLDSFSHDTDNPQFLNILHQSLARIYAAHLTVDRWTTRNQFSPAVAYVQKLLERHLENHNGGRARRQLEGINFGEISDFRRWYRKLLWNHPASDHPLFHYLANEASIEEMAYFFSQEVTIDSRFDDLLALLQIGQPPAIKMVLAENYWDEMGNGACHLVHTAMFENLLKELSLIGQQSAIGLITKASWESLACGNLLIYCAIHRANTGLAFGAMGAVEVLAPTRFSHLIKGFQRLGLSSTAKEYHNLHIKIDAKHGNCWIDNAILPLVAHRPEFKQEIAYGALYRLNTSLDYLNAIYTKLRANLVESN